MRFEFTVGYVYRTKKKKSFYVSDQEVCVEGTRQ